MNSTKAKIDKAVEAIKSGDIKYGKNLLSEVVKENPKSARAWYILSQVITDEQQKIDCLKRVLEIKPDYEKARHRLNELRFQEINITENTSEEIKFSNKPDFQSYYQGMSLSGKELPHCSFCNIPFHTRELLLQHIERFHQDEISYYNICLKCGECNRKDANYCDSCGNRIANKATEQPIDEANKPSINDYTRSLGIGAGLIPTSVGGGIVTGATLALIGSYIAIGFGIAKGYSLFIKIFTLIMCSPILVPMSVAFAIIGGIGGSIAGAIVGVAGFLVSSIFHVLPRNGRYTLVILAMTIVGVISVNLALDILNNQSYFDATELSSSARLWIQIGGGLYGLVMGFVNSFANDDPLNDE